MKNFIDENLKAESQVLAVDIDPILIQRAEETYSNSCVIFKCLDIMDNLQRSNVIDNYLNSKHLNTFSVTFCFSITMWIHLNYGDDGLKNFLKYIASISEILVIEPQLWKCYKTAVKRVKQHFSFPHFHNLKIQQNIDKEIETYLLSECALVKIEECGRTAWDRKLLIFKQNT